MAEQHEFKVVIAGGGVAGIEALLAVREQLRGRADLELISPASDFVDRPLAVVEPFGRGEARRVPLTRISRDCGARLRRDRLAEVDAERRSVTTADGAELGYDALVLALGTRPEDALPGATTYRGGIDTDALRAVLDRVRAGESDRIVFAAPATVRWVLPLYELAMLSAAEVGGLRDEVSLTLVTPEAAPLDAFGATASQAVREALAAAGVELITHSAPSAVRDQEVRLAGGDAVPADEVLALPKLVVEALQVVRVSARWRPGVVG